MKIDAGNEKSNNVNQIMNWYLINNNETFSFKMYLQPLKLFQHQQALNVNSLLSQRKPNYCNVKLGI